MVFNTPKQPTESQTMKNTISRSNIYRHPQILRKPKVLELTGYSQTTLFNRIKNGLFPRQISLGARAVGFVSSEVDAVIQFMIEEKTPEQIKELVKELIANRHSENRFGEQ